jgi:hypothetical protein
VSQTYWTREVEEALSAGGATGVKAYHAKLLQQLDDLTKLVRLIPAVWCWRPDA